MVQLQSFSTHSSRCPYEALYALATARSKLGSAFFVMTPFRDNVLLGVGGKVNSTLFGLYFETFVVYGCDVVLCDLW